MNNAPPVAGDVSLSDPAIRTQFSGISKMTLCRWRNDRGFPRPSFYVGTRAYTWKSHIDDWLAAQPNSNEHRSFNLTNHQAA